MTKPTLDLLRKSLPILKKAAAARQIHSTAAVHSQPKFILFGTEHRGIDEDIASRESVGDLLRRKLTKPNDTIIGLEKLHNGIPKELRKMVTAELSSAKKITQFLDSTTPNNSKNSLTRMNRIGDLKTAMWQNFCEVNDVEIFELDDPNVTKAMEAQCMQAVKNGRNFDLNLQNEMVAKYEKMRIASMMKRIFEMKYKYPQLRNFFLYVGLSHLPSLSHEISLAIPESKILCISAFSEQVRREMFGGDKTAESAEEILRYLELSSRHIIQAAGLEHTLVGFEKRNRREILPEFGQSIPVFSAPLQTEIREMFSGQAKVQPKPKSNAKPRILIVEISDHRDVMSNMAWLRLFKRFLEEGVIKASNTSFLFENHDEKIGKEELAVLETLGERFKDLSIVTEFFNDPQMINDMHSKATIAESINNAVWRKFAKEKGLNILNLETHEKVSANITEILNEESRVDMAKYTARVLEKEVERNADMVENISNALNDNVIVFVGSGHSPGLRSELQKLIPGAQINCAISVSEQGLREVFTDGKKGRTPLELLEQIIEWRDNDVKKTVFASSVDDHVVTAAMLGESQNFLDFDKGFTDAMRNILQATPSHSPSEASAHEQIKKQNEK